MEQLEYSRKVDNSGRVIIPAQLREKLDIRPGDSLDFYLHEDEDKTFLCFHAFRVETEIEKAKRILREAGIQI